jgi:DNA repair protein RadA/Sms
MAVYVCRRCDHSQDAAWEGACPACAGLYRFKKQGVDTAMQGNLTTMGGSKHKSAYVYLSTGNPGFDHVLGGGFVAGRVVLLGGFAGTGKTRALLGIADYIAKTQGVVIYASGEESTDDIAGVCAQLGLVNDRVVLLGSQQSVEKVLELAKKMKAFLVIYDSAQKFASDYSAGTPGSGAQCKAVGEAIKTHCGQTKTCAVVVNQMSGQGDLKGGTELEHHCDTIMILAYPKEDDESAPTAEGIRVLAGSKNRVGEENQNAYFRMRGKEEENPGTLEHVPARSRLIVEPGRGKYRKKSDDEDDSN